MKRLVSILFVLCLVPNVPKIIWAQQEEICCQSEQDNIYLADEPTDSVCNLLISIRPIEYVWRQLMLWEGGIEPYSCAWWLFDVIDITWYWIPLECNCYGNDYYCPYWTSERSIGLIVLLLGAC